MKNKSFLYIIIAILFIGFSAVLWNTFQQKQELEEAQNKIEEQKMLLGVQEGNVFNLRDDINVLKDSLRLIRIGEIKIDTVNQSN